MLVFGHNDPYGAYMAQASLEPREYLSLSEAAERAGLSVKSVRRYFDNGDLTGFVTPGGHRRIATASLDRLTGRNGAS